MVQLNRCRQTHQSVRNTAFRLWSFCKQQFRFTVRVRKTLTPSTWALHAFFLQCQPISCRPTDCLTFKPYPRNFTRPALVYVPNRSNVCHQGLQQHNHVLVSRMGKRQEAHRPNTTNSHVFRKVSLQHRPLNDVVCFPIPTQD